MKAIREKRHRLSEEMYRGLKIVAFTLCVKDRKPFFTNEIIFQECETILRQELERFYCDALVYVFMPDHCHLLLQGRNETSQALKVIKGFKQKTGFWLSKHVKTVFWQKDFYDHVLRKDEDILTQVRYILGNPVRKGLVEDWKKYPYKGSTVYDFT